MLLHRWLRFWFRPAAPTNLAFSRMLFFAGVFAAYSGQDLSEWASVSSAFWMPIPLFSELHLSVASPEALVVAQTIWRVALVCSAAGVVTRASMAVAFALGIYLLGLPHNFGHVFHFDALLVIAMGVFAASRAGDAWSIDAWRRGRRDIEPSGEYTWPLRAIWVAMSLVFFAAGLAKLRYGGLAWITSNNMSILLIRALYHVSDADPLTRFGLWIAQHHWLASAVAASALVIEITFPLALVSRTARIVLVPAACAMLIGIRALMGPTFGGFLVATVVWVPWDALALRAEAWARTRRRSASEPSTSSSLLPPLL